MAYLGITSLPNPGAKPLRFTYPGDNKGTLNGFLYHNTDGSLSAGSWKEGTGVTCYYSPQDARRELTAAELYARAGHAKDDHPYLVKKHIDSLSLGNLRYPPKQSGPRLVIPILAKGNVISLQYIDPLQEPSKWFKKGTNPQEGYYPFGNLTDSTAILLCEGWATGLSLHLETSIATVVAFSAGNMVKCAIKLRREYPLARILICADNDAAGKKYGKAASRAIGEKMVHPSKSGEDYNDLWARQETFKPHILEALEPEANTPESHGESMFIVTKEGAKPGLYKVTASCPIWVCSLIDYHTLYKGTELHYGVTILTHNGAKNIIINGAWINSTCEPLRKWFERMGGSIDYSCAKLLAKYLTSTPPPNIKDAIERQGWNNGQYYIGTEDGAVFTPKLGMVCRGALNDWQLLTPYLVTPISRAMLMCAFAPPLLAESGMPGAGIHLYGASSTGKSTMARICASVWGGEEYMNSWRATGNFIESACVEANDALLVLDELSVADLGTVQSTIYCIANGQGKGRLDKDSMPRSIRRWRTFCISTGESSIQSVAQAADMDNQGASLRLLNILLRDPILANQDDIDAIENIVRHNYGVAIQEFIRGLTDTRIQHALKRVREDERWQFPKETPQATRVSRVFEMILAAAFIASQQGILMWTKDDIFADLCEMYALWEDGLSQEGDAHPGMSAEERSILSSICDFVEKHGDTNFRSEGQPYTAAGCRYGWRTVEPNGKGVDVTVYWFLPFALREALPRGRRRDIMLANRILDKYGFFYRISKERKMVKATFDGVQRDVYAICPRR